MRIWMHRRQETHIPAQELPSHAKRCGDNHTSKRKRKIITRHPLTRPTYAISLYPNPRIFYHRFASCHLFFSVSLFTRISSFVNVATKSKWTIAKEYRIASRRSIVLMFCHVKWEILIDFFCCTVWRLATIYTCCNWRLWMRYPYDR